MSTSFYVASFLFGGILIAASTLGGDHGDHAGDHDAAHDSAGKGPPLPFLSLRFWSFALAFFGLAGLAFRGVAPTSGLLAPVFAGIFGLGAGLGASRLLGALTKRPTGTLASARALIGKEGRLLLPLVAGQRSKLRVDVGGVTSDFLAESNFSAAQTPDLPSGTQVIVVGWRGTIALVERNPAPSSDESKL